MKKLRAWSPWSSPLVGFNSRNCFLHLSCSSVDTFHSLSGTCGGDSGRGGSAAGQGTDWGGNTV